MTNEEIEAAREALESLVNTAAGSGYATSADEQDALERLSALCAAAREPERLVGKRVRGRNWPENSHGIITDGPLYRIEVRIGDSMCRTPTLSRDDFELLEGGG